MGLFLRQPLTLCEERIPTAFVAKWLARPVEHWKSKWVPPQAAFTSGADVLMRLPPVLYFSVGSEIWQIREGLIFGPQTLPLILPRGFKTQKT